MQYCTHNKGITYFHDSKESAERYKTKLGLDTIIWESGTDNPNPKYDEGYHKLQPDFTHWTPLTDYDYMILSHDKHLCRYSKNGY